MRRLSFLLFLFPPIPPLWNLSIPPLSVYRRECSLFRYTMESIVWTIYGNSSTAFGFGRSAFNAAGVVLLLLFILRSEHFLYLSVTWHGLFGFRHPPTSSFDIKVRQVMQFQRNHFAIPMKSISSDQRSRFWTVRASGGNWRIEKPSIQHRSVQVMGHWFKWRTKLIPFARMRFVFFHVWALARTSNRNWRQNRVDTLAFKAILIFASLHLRFCCAATQLKRKSWSSLQWPWCGGARVGGVHSTRNRCEHAKLVLKTEAKTRKGAVGDAHRTQ